MQDRERQNRDQLPVDTTLEFDVPSSDMEPQACQVPKRLTRESRGNAETAVSSSM